MLKKIKMTALLCSIAALSGCMSSNIKSYRVDPSLKLDIQHTNMKSVFLNPVSMPHDDSNSIMCRMAGNIYLPQKMTYSQYIDKALRKSLMVLDKLSEAKQNAHSLTIVLTRVTFDTLAGKWFIDADVTVDQKPSVSIKSVTEYGTSFIAVTACQNTAESFDEATAHFIRHVLNDKDISLSLK